jgi:hypothetical protein
MGRGGAWVSLVVAAMLLAMPGGAQARQRHAGKYEVQRANTEGFARLGKEKGYRMALYMPTDRIVVFYAFRIRGRREGFVADYGLYAARNQGSLKRGVVRARFGSLGRVSLRFQPSRRVRKGGPRSGCEGGEGVAESGRFVGRLAFHGEGNYFHVSTAAVRGDVARSPRLRCEKGVGVENPPRSLRKYVAPIPALPDESSIALLYAHARSHGRYVGITAVHPEGAPPGAEVQLAIVESRRGMAIGHGAYLEGGRGTLLTSLPGAHPATATLVPPTPFYGEAAYSEQSHAWTGTLGVELAGLKLPLTGPAFKVHLCVVNPLKDRDRCNFFKTEPPPDERPALSLGWALR